MDLQATSATATMPLADVADYYANKFARFGATARGVDWNGTEGQFRRFEQLCRVLPVAGRFSVNDLGCGYGGLLEYLDRIASGFEYRGYDLSEPMLASARQRSAARGDAVFVLASQPTATANFGIASGIFNVRLAHPDDEWRAYIEATIAALDRTSTAGFAFNCLTAYSDADKRREDLYYADPCTLFDLCKRRYARNVALLHDYDLYEFTILVRK